MYPSHNRSDFFIVRNWIEQWVRQAECGLKFVAALKYLEKLCWQYTEFIDSIILSYENKKMSPRRPHQQSNDQMISDIFNYAFFMWALCTRSRVCGQIADNGLVIKECHGFVFQESILNFTSKHPIEQITILFSARVVYFWDRQFFFSM